MDPAADINQEAIEALKSGRKIEAIRVVRENDNLGLKEAKEKVEAWVKANGHMYPEIAQQKTGSGGLVFGCLVIIGILAAAAYFMGYLK